MDLKSNKFKSSNWNNLKAKVLKNKYVPNNVSSDKGSSTNINKVIPKEEKLVQLSSKLKASYVGLDCEMVGIGADGIQSALARACVVDYDGNVLYDEYVRPPSYVTDFRTKYSGIRKKDLRQGTAVTLAECQNSVAALLKGKILVGHALKNDLDVLMLSHPRKMIRDTSKYRPYMRPHGKHGKWRPRSLKDLTKQHLNLEIQSGEHNPSEDARCAMLLYIKEREKWEKELRDNKNAARNKADNLILENHEIAISHVNTSISNHLNYNNSAINDDTNNENNKINNKIDNTIENKNIDYNNTEAIIIRESTKKKKNIPLANISLISPTIDIEVEVLNGINENNNIYKENKRKISSRGFINIPNKNSKKIHMSHSVTILNNNISNNNNNKSSGTIKNNKIKSHQNSMFETSEYEVFGLGIGNAKNIKSISDIHKHHIKNKK